jgi:tetratricopeptide (TPR) repeat protein
MLLASSGREVVSLPFTDRVKELDYLKSFVDEAISGQGNLVFVSGEAGIGKTRLVQELEKYASGKGMRCLNSKCYRQSEAGSVYPYSAFIQFIRQFSEEASIQLFYRVCGTSVNKIIRLVPELADNLLPTDSNSSSITSSEEEVQPQQSPEAVQREEMLLLQSVTEFFFSLSKEKPLLLFIDDWQWCGQSSLKLLQFIRSRNLTQYPVLTVCAYRDTDIGEQLSEDVRPWISDCIKNLETERSLKLVHLERFDLFNVANLIERVFSKERVKDEFLNLIYSRTGGNPFFVEEVLKSLVEDGTIFRDSYGKWQRKKEISEISIPKSISTVIEHRLDRLGTETQKILSIASVLGEKFDFEILKKVIPDIGLEKQRALLDNALKSGLVVEISKGNSPTTPRYSFSDESVRDVLYEGISSVLRTSYHRNVALILEDDFKNKGKDIISEHALELAHHFLLCGNQAKSLEYFILAGRRASSLYAHQLACRSFHSALDIISQPFEKAGNKGKQNILKRAELLDALAFEAQFVPSEFQNVARYWEEAVSIYESTGQRRKAAQILGSWLVLIYYVMLFDLEKSEQSSKRAISLLDGEKDADFERAHLYSWRIIDLVWKGERQNALNDCKIAIELGEKTGAYGPIVMANSWPTGVYTLDEFQKGIDESNYGIQLSLDHGLFTEASLCYFQKAVYYVNKKGASKQALDFLLESLVYSEKTGQLMVNLFTKTELAYEVYLPLGEWKKAEELADDVQKTVQSFPPSSFFAIVADSVYGQILAHKGELETAEEYLERVESKTKGYGILQLDVPLYLCLAKVHMKKGEDEKAKNYLSEAYRRSKKRGLVVINCVPHVQLLSLMIEFALRKFGKQDSREFEEVNSLFLELSEACKQINEEWAFAYLKKTQGLIESSRNELASAKQSIEKSIELWAKLGWRHEFGLTTSLLAEVYLSDYDISKALNLNKESLQVFEELGAKLEIERVRKSKEECEHLINILRLDDTSIEILSEEKSRLVFQYLVKSFIEDSVVNKIPTDRCGWRSLGMIEKKSGVSGSLLYAKSGGTGSMVNQLIQSKLVESATFSGERGRGGEITKLRVACFTSGGAKELVDRELRNKI